jgi:hypothetical protein
MQWKPLGCYMGRAQGRETKLVRARFAATAKQDGIVRSDIAIFIENH